MAKIKIDSNLYDRVKKTAAAAGYSSIDEFVRHCIEKEIADFESSQIDENVADRLKGLGYIE